MSCFDCFILSKKEKVISIIWKRQRGLACVFFIFGFSSFAFGGGGTSVRCVNDLYQLNANDSNLKRFNIARDNKYYKIQSGTFRVDYIYRSNNLEGQYGPKHSVRYSLNPKIEVLGLPMQLNMSYASDYRGNALGKFHLLQVTLDKRLLNNQIDQYAKKRFEQELKRIENELDELKDSLEVSRKLAYKRVDLDSLLGYRDSFSNTDTLAKGKYRSPLEFDSLDLPNIEFVNLMDDTLCLARIKELEDKIDQVTKNLEKLRIKLASLNDAKSTVSKTSLEKLRLKDFQLGNLNINQGQLFQNHENLYGGFLESEYKFLQVNLILGVGRNISRFSDWNHFNPIPEAGNQRWHIGGGVKVNAGDRTAISYHILQLKEIGLENNQERVDPLNRMPIQGINQHIGLNWRIHKRSQFSAELSHSSNLLYRKVLDIHKQENRTGQDWLTPLAHGAALFNLKGETSKGMHYKIDYTAIGASYINLLNPFFRNNRQRVGLGIEKSWWANKLSISSNYTIEQEVFGQRSINMQSHIAQNKLKLGFKTWPTLMITHQFIRRTMASNDQLSVGQMDLHVLSMIAAKVWKLKKNRLVTIQAQSQAQETQMERYGHRNVVLGGQAGFRTANISVDAQLNQVYFNGQQSSLQYGFDLGYLGFKRFVINGGFSKNQDVWRAERTDYKLSGIYRLGAKTQFQSSIQYFRFTQTETQTTHCQITWIQSW